MTLSEKVVLLRASLPPEKQQGLADLRRQFAKDAERLQQRQEKERPLLMEKAYNAEHARAMQSIASSKMPPPQPKIIEQKAHEVARQHVVARELKGKQQLQQRVLEREYDYLKRAQPDHPLLKADVAKEVARAKDRFNEAAKSKQNER